ncbi:MAG: hypothetical protein KGY38_08145 [Desulfobacterales bacterium]|nr:hypothetical protein [Desulfobacterales bacterium]
MEDIDFGDIGLKIGDEIVFKENKQVLVVGSGRGIPGNGGSLVHYPCCPGNLFTLRLMTKSLLGQKYAQEIDIWQLWEYQDKTLRDRYITHYK